jgi:CDP-diacylglycerol--glycerol-3-phosphate 3-phosphatidyltransferase
MGKVNENSSPGRAVLLPLALTTLRLLLAPVMLAIAYAGGWGPAFVVCLAVAFFSDLFDGILARRLGVAGPGLRIYDSTTDTVFYAAVIWSAWVAYPDVARAHVWVIVLFVGLELVYYTICLVKFRRQPSFHAWTSKCWGVALWVAFTALLGFGVTGVLFYTMIGLGILAELETLAIALVLPAWEHDVPTVLHAWRIRRAWRPRVAQE